MSAYIIVFIEQVSDPAAIAEYRRIGLPTLLEHKPEMLVRAMPAETLEGAAVDGGVVVLRFPDKAAARAWYDSPGYQEALQHRLRGAISHAVLVEDGLPA